MLWEIEIRPAPTEFDREALRILEESRGLGLPSVTMVTTAHSFLLQGELDREAVDQVSRTLLSDSVTETFSIHALGEGVASGASENEKLLNVLFKDRKSVV